MEQVSSPAKIQQRKSLNSDHSPQSSGDPDSQGISSGSSIRVSNEVHDGPVTAQPTSLRLDYPKSPTRRLLERIMLSILPEPEFRCALPRDGLPLEYGQPPPGIREPVSKKMKKVIASFCPCCCCCCGDP